MKNLNLIAAIGKNNELGKDNKLIWHFKGDLAFFKNQTMNSKIIMGINTLNSLPRLLPGREHIVLTHQDIEIPGVRVYHDKNALLDYIKTLDEDVYVIGGASIYEQFLDLSERLFLTEIDRTYDADVFFPNFDKTQYERTVLSEQEENNTKYRHVLYKRKNN